MTRDELPVLIREMVRVGPSTGDDGSRDFAGDDGSRDFATEEARAKACDIASSIPDSVPMPDVIESWHGRILLVWYPRAMAVYSINIEGDGTVYHSLTHKTDGTMMPHIFTRALERDGTV